MSRQKEVYVLLVNRDGTMRSSDEPFGVAVTNKDEAERYVEEGKVGYSHSYAKLTVFNNKDEAIKFAFKKGEDDEVFIKDIIEKERYSLWGVSSNGFKLYIKLDENEGVIHYIKEYSDGSYSRDEITADLFSMIGKYIEDNHTK